MKALFFTFLTTMCFCFLANTTTAQTSSKVTDYQSASLPIVFMLGEHDKLYESAVPGYISLLDACGSDMRTAYNKLLDMMREMEVYAVLEKYDIKGINAWMHFFWGENGNIEHIGFYLKPNSRNVDTEKLRSFLKGFAAWYKMPIHSDKKFAHYSSFAFPLSLQGNTNDNGTVKKSVGTNY